MNHDTTSDPRLVEEKAATGLPALVHADWMERFPWVVQGCTTRGPDAAPLDFGLFSDASPAQRIMEAWQILLHATEMPRAVHAHQVHGAEVRVHDEGPPGLLVGRACDGHVTNAAGVLLAVTTADCVPVFLVDPRHRIVAALHAGWRGSAAGILEAGLDRMREVGADDPGLHVHLGPAICGRCYEVGPEVFESLGEPVPQGPTPIDLRAVLARRAVAWGVEPAHVTISSHCTRCTRSGLFSHRGGDRERQVGYIGIRV